MMQYVTFQRYQWYHHHNFRGIGDTAEIVFAVWGTFLAVLETFRNKILSNGQVVCLNIEQLKLKNFSTISVLSATNTIGYSTAMAGGGGG
jgi:hypothetical protein